MPICAISDTLRAPDGSILVNTSVRFVRQSPAVVGQLGDVVVPNEVTATSDGAGLIEVELYPGRYFAFVVSSGRLIRFGVGVPDEATAILSALIDQYPPITTTALDQVQAAAAEAATSAETAAAAAVAANAIAGPYATRAEFLAASISATATRTSFYVNGNTYAVVRDNAGPITQTNGQRWRPDGDVSIVHFGDYSATNNSPALQAAVDYVLSLSAGGDVHIPAGTWPFASTITVDISANAGLPNTQYKGVSIVGAGARGTVLKAQTNSMTLIEFIGASTLTTASYAYRTLLRDLSLAGNSPTARSTTGVLIRDMAFWHINDVAAFNLGTAISLDSALSGYMNGFRCRENTNGIVGVAGQSHCNAITLESCNIQNCTNRGISITGGCSNLTILGGSVEGCGTQGDLSTGGIYLEGSGSQGEVALSTIGAYIELNRGGFDVNIAEVGGNQVTHSHTGSMFQRASSSNHVVSNIVTTGDVRTVLSGCSFTKGNTYVADAGRPYLNIGTGGRLVDLGCRWEDDVEAPRRDQTASFSGFVQGSLGASVTGSLPRGWTVSQISTGLFRVTHNFGHTNYAPIATITSANARFVERIVRNSASFDVRVLRTADNVATDDDFSFSVSQYGGAT